MFCPRPKVWGLLSLGQGWDLTKCSSVVEPGKPTCKGTPVPKLWFVEGYLQLTALVVKMHTLMAYPICTRGCIGSNSLGLNLSSLWILFIFPFDVEMPTGRARYSKHCGPL